MISTAPFLRLEAEPAIARMWPLALGLTLALTVSTGGSLLSLAPSMSEEAAEAPSTSCVGCHTGVVPEGTAPEAPSGSQLQRLAECRR